MADAANVRSSLSSPSTFETSAQPIGPLVNDNHDNIDILKKELERLRRECDTANAYNEDLRRQVDALSQELIKAKANASSTRTSIAVQVTPEDLEAYIAEGNWLVASQKANVSVADCVRAAAEEVTARTGYVYDEQSGYYYDNTSGYYYNAEQSLYYDAKTGIYFFYNADTKTYDFHSQVDLSLFKPSEGDETKTEEPAAVVADVVKEKSPEKSADDKKESRSKRKKARKHKQRERDKMKEKSRKTRHRRDSNSRRSKKRLRLSGNRSRKSDSDDDDDDDYSDCRALASDSNEDRGTSSLEEGECSGSITDDNSIEKIDSESSDNVKLEETGCQWPPCIRVIVLETSVEQLSFGTLFLVTCTGAIVGRETSADIQLSDMEVSKAHAQFSYDESEKGYVLKDLGSQNGTVLNGVRLSKTKLESEPEAVKHGDVVQFGSTKLVLHIHKGMDTCDDCEPGQIQASIVAQNPETKEIIILSKEEKERERKRALKQIKKKFGLETASYSEESASTTDPNYKDRAQVRRKTKGSDNPYEKTEVASVNSAIPAKNKGFKMLEKMGWSTGQSLGKSQAGIVEPITVEGKASKVGLGFDGPSSSTVVQYKKDVVKRENWSKAQKRYQQLQESNPQDVDSAMQQDNE